jgi:hypothetical protein
LDYPAGHAGVVRAERAAQIPKPAAARRFNPNRAGASLLLAAVVAAMLVVAGEVIDTWTEGHLLAAWSVMWIVAFAALALLAVPARRAALAIRAGLKNWDAAARKQRAEDDQLWQLAMTSTRVMAEISRAASDSDEARERLRSFSYRYY